MSELNSKELIQASRRKQAAVALVIWLILAIINTVVFIAWISSNSDMSLGVLFFFLGFAQFVLAIFGVVQGARGNSTALITLGALSIPFGFAGWIIGSIWGFLQGLGGLGGAWGRPLRIRGRQLHPELREGSDWTEGERPNPTGLDEPTRAALETLWLHDAQKEHASVPAFARISWLLAAMGAPAELLA